MNKLLTGIFVLVLAVGFSGLVRADEGKLPAGEFLTVIDVANLTASGLSDADIAKLLSEQRGYDRLSAINRGKTDEQIIKYLTTDERDAKRILDNNNSMQYKANGDKYYGELKFDKAAKEYALAIDCSNNNQVLYKLRADAIKQYIIAKLDPLFKSGSDKSKLALLAKSRKLLCSSIYADYNKALKINDETIQSNTSELYLIKKKMKNMDINYDDNTAVLPYYKKSSEKTLDMRQLHGLYNAQRAARQNDMNIRKAIADYKLICREEDTAGQELIKN